MNRRTMLLANRGLAILKQEGNHSFPFLDLFVSTCIYIHRTLVSILYKNICNIHASFLLNLPLPDLT